MSLPDGWAESTIEEIAAPIPRAIVDGPFGSALKSEHYTDGGARVIRLNNIAPGRFNPDDAAFISMERFEALRAHDANAGDLVTAALGEPLGRTCLVPEGLGPAIVKADCFRTRLSDEVDHDFILAMINSPSVRQSFADQGQGIGRIRINLGVLRSTSLPIPPFPEQRRIVAKLDALTARLARARAELHRVQHLATRFRDEARASAYTGKLTRDLRNGADANWSVRPLQAIARVVTGATPPTADKANLFGGDVPFFKPTDLDAGYHVSEPRETLTEAGAARSRVVPAGSTLVTCIGATIGKTGFARVKCAFNQQINAVVPNSGDVEPRWLYWAITAPAFRTAIIENASATTMPIINKGRFQALELPVPPLQEQVAIANRLEAAFARADRLEAEAARAQALLDRLDAALLAKAFRGRLVPQDPNDEPASALLDRIRAQRASAPGRRRGLDGQRRPSDSSATAQIGDSQVKISRGKVLMTKSRRDEDVWHKPYLATKLKHIGAGSIQELFRQADLPVADFYKQLAWEITHQHIVDSNEELRAA